MSYKLSFIIPVYNRAKLLKRCLHSVLDANRSDVEIIIVDDASTDDTVSVARSYADRYENIRLIELEKNCGPGAARNAGIDQAKGEYLHFLDSDDNIITENLSKLIDVLDGRVDVVVFNSIDVYINKKMGSHVPVTTKSGIVNSDEFFELYRDDFFSVTWVICFRHEFILQQGIRFAPIYGCEDTCFATEALMRAGTFCLLPVIIYCYNRENGFTLSMQQIVFSLKQECEGGMAADTSTDIGLKERAIVCEVIDSYLRHATGVRREWLLRAIERMKWSSLRYNNEVIPESVIEEIARFAKQLDGLEHPLYFMPATAYRLFRLVEKLASFIMGGLLDNLPGDNNPISKLLRGQGFSISSPGELAGKPAAILLLSFSKAQRNTLLEQLEGLGFKAVLRAGTGMLTLLVNYDTSKEMKT